jgi:hypothetical protein
MSRTKPESSQDKESRLSRKKNVKVLKQPASHNNTRAKIMGNVMGIEKKENDEIDVELEDRLARADGYLRRASRQTGESGLGWFHTPKEPQKHKPDIDDADPHFDVPRVSVSRKPSIVHTHTVLLGAIGQKPKDEHVDPNSRLPPLQKITAAT